MSLPFLVSSSPSQRIVPLIPDFSVSDVFRFVSSCFPRHSFNQLIFNQLAAELASIGIKLNLTLS